VTIEQLRERCTVWQERLRLQDWQITVEYVRERTLDHAWGDLNRRHENHRMANIRITDPASFFAEDFQGNEVISDPEYILVHELIHVYTEGILAGREREGKEDVWAEQTADALARALLALDRVN
jgi:hypothetical protein